ncbi:MAG: hypothetical protein ACI9XU_001870, partial [Arenicella sp.]
VLSVDGANTAANALKMKIFSNELADTNNFNAAGWLKYGIRKSEKATENREAVKLK